MPRQIVSLGARMTKKEFTKKNMIGQPIKVDWVDSMSSHGWRDYPYGTMNCSTVGFYYREFDDRVVVALNRSFDSEDNFGTYIDIPKVAIKKMRKLK